MSARNVCAAALLLAAVAGCDGNRLGPVDGQFVAVRVHGEVRSDAGAPISGVAVRLEAHVPGACDQFMFGTTVTSDAEGRYRGTLGLFGREQDTCLRVRATPPAAIGVGADVRRDTLPLRVREDSVRVDIVIQSTQQ